MRCMLIYIRSILHAMRILLKTPMFPSVSFFFSSRRRHTRWTGDWSSDVCSSDLDARDVARDHEVGAEPPPRLDLALLIAGREIDARGLRQDLHVLARHQAQAGTGAQRGPPEDRKSVV